jgi:iron-sulfur cluster insertion protein
METQEPISPPQGQPPLSPFEVTASALTRIAKLLSDEPAGSVFRVAVLGGGCSGFQYQYAIDAKAPAEGDFVISQERASVAVDDVSLGLLHGSVLDYEEDLSGAGFIIRNPNAKARCGCGNSFSVL